MEFQLMKEEFLRREQASAVWPPSASYEVCAVCGADSGGSVLYFNGSLPLWLVATEGHRADAGMLVLSS